MVEPDDPRLRFVPIEKVCIAPEGYCIHYKDYWWVYDPKRGLVFWQPTARRTHRFPQCNKAEGTTRHLAKKLYPWAEIKFVPSVFVPEN